MSIIDLAQTAFPGAPAAGFSRLYVDTSGSLHVILDNGTDIQLGVQVSGSGGAPIDAKYLVLGLSDGLTNERVFSAGQGIEFSDGGPGGLFTMSLGAHKSQHATGGSDALSPSDIGSAEAVHTHLWADITDPPAGLSADMEKAVYDTDNDGKVEAADTADSVPWAGIPDKPATFTPSAHTHVGTDVTSAVANANAVPWTGVSGKPATFPPDAHTHDDRYYTEGELNTSGAGGAVHWNNVTNKPTVGDMVKTTYDPDNDGKVESADSADSVPWMGVTDKPTEYPPEAHTHPFGLEVIIGNGVDGVPLGIIGYLVVPWDCTVQSCTLVADAAGSIVVDIWRGSGAKPTSSAQSIVASANPALSSVDYATDTTLTGWTTSLSAGDILAFFVGSSSTVKQVTLALRGTR